MRGLLVGITLLVGTSGCAALNRTGPAHQFLERNYVALVPQDSSLMYEAQVAIPIFFVDGLSTAYDAVARGKGSAHAWRVLTTPMFRVRQLSDSSAAVRTPSFMPRVSVEYTTVHRRGKISGDPANPLFAGVRIDGARLTLAHHSNGQAGCFREGFEPVDSRANECRPIPGADTNLVQLNRANGDFSSTYLSLLLHSTWTNRNGAGDATRTVGFGLSGDWHPKGIFGALSDEQRALYGSWRLRALAEGMYASGSTCEDDGRRTFLCALRGRSRLTTEYERAPKDPGDLASRIQPPVVPYRTSIEMSHAFDTLLGAGVFVRWIDGQDHYNIGFVNRRKLWMFGAMLDLGGPNRIVKRSS